MSTANFSLESAQEYLQHIRLELHVQEYRIAKLEKKVSAFNFNPVFINAEGYNVDDIDTESLLSPIEDDFWTVEDLYNF